MGLGSECQLGVEIRRQKEARALCGPSRDQECPGKGWVAVPQAETAGAVPGPRRRGLWPPPHPHVG